MKIDYWIAATELSCSDDSPDEDAVAANNLVLLQHAIDCAYGCIQQWRAGNSLAPRRISESVRATDTVEACE